MQYFAYFNLVSTDFRTEGTGLYDNLQKYNLPYPEAVFDLSFYMNNPDPFVQLASELWPGLRHSPTVTHSFIALLEKKGMLLRNYTQVCHEFVS
jgi:NAD-dependent SIR2 family protein deacetylase